MQNSPIEVVTDAVTLNPAAARARQHASCRLRAGFEVRAVVDGHTVVVDESTGLGGTDTGPSPVGFALLALGSGHAITYQLWSQRLSIPFGSLSVTVCGDMDLRGRLGVDERVRPGIGRVEIDVAIRGDEAPDRYEALRRAVESHCPILDVFRHPVPWTSRLHVDRTGPRVGCGGGLGSDPREDDQWLLGDR